MNTYHKGNKPDQVAFLDGALLLIDKPLEWTSFDVVNKLRHTLRYTLGIKGRTKVKVGHAGTLDPMATGLLLICTGKYTKKINDLTLLSKSYTGNIKLGATTPSYDAEADEDMQYSTDHISKELIESKIGQFRGDIMQKPPIYSAIKKKGEKLYQLARRGETVEIEPRPVTIFDFKIEYDHPDYTEWDCLPFFSEVSKGTYIRSLAHDFGQALDSGGYLTGLRRTAVAEYSVEDAFSVDEAVEWIRASAYKPEL